MEQLPDWAILLRSLGWSSAGRITLAALFGGIIGLEREWRGHSAGFRTNILVSVGACLFTILSIEGFPLRGSAQDTARIAAQIVSGVGFLGAGALLQTPDKVKGMTTAATIWLVAAIGMAAGAGAYFLATFTTLLTTIVLQSLRSVDKLVARRQAEEEKQEAGEASTTPEQ